MTPAEIITLARSHFGEPSAVTITADIALSFLNEAMREIYSDLPASRLKNLLTESSVTVASENRGPIVNTWDKVIEVYVDNKPAVKVSKETIRNTELNSYFTSPVPIFYIDEKYVWVRPHDEPVKIVHLDPPSTIVTAGLGTEITEIHSAYHEAIANLVASYMYAQEEDIVQAQHYKAEYTSKLSNVSERLAAEVGG